ncbi:related to peptide transport protein [Cephalotrichum gorgonifer]|uniref:Related to peptide transport protein n=1 Tax=Cephalotrichum gorgonifer TaxID=2041049 RepID=A0AAE8MSV0_9PEZI|nr:related to peptide transport protein [Cephalotrichum gorgonifer]
MSSGGNQQTADIAKAVYPAAADQGTEKELVAGKGSMDQTKFPTAAYDSTSDSDYDDKPTEEDLRTLRRVSGPLNWAMFSIAVAELAERFSYYGSSVLYTNFVQRPLPPGSNTGASEGTTSRIPGALGQGQKASQGISLFNQFFAYFMPLVGGWIADAHLGRYKTIHVAIAVSMIGHVVLTAASAPKVIIHTKSAFGAFIIGLLTLCVGTGFFKANISPLLAEQNEDTRMRVEVRNGERVLVDPAITSSRIFLYFYLCINIGSCAGQISMVFAEKYDSGSHCNLIPTGLFIIVPFVLWSQKKKYKLSPPTGSVLETFLRLYYRAASKTGWFKKPNWDFVRPSKIAVSERPTWMTYDDAWVDEVRRGLVACRVFLFLPIFHLAYNQMSNNLSAQAATMRLDGAPNDVIQNLNPISIVIMIPILDHVVYPAFRKAKIHLSPIRRMAIGFFFAAAAMVAAAVMQHYIYKMSPCGDHASDEGCEAPISVWAQCLPYILIGISELFTNVSSYEYAFAKAPVNMKSLVMSINLFMSAISAAIGQAFTPMSGDPLLVWNYTTIAAIAFIGGIAFYWTFGYLHEEEDELNNLKVSKYLGDNKPNAVGQQADAQAEEQQAQKA